MLKSRLPILILHHNVSHIQFHLSPQCNNPSFLFQYAKSALKPAAVADKFTINYRPEPGTMPEDYVGPPDKQSNLRPVVRCVTPNETETARKLRLMQNDVESWNHNFWTKHNKRFYEERQAFTEANRKAADQALSADEMSVFYKEFLDKNWRLHFYYNLSWYIKNWSMLFLALRVELETLTKRRNKVAS